MYTHAWQNIMHFSCIIEENINFNPLTTVHEALSSKTLSRTKFVQQKRSSLIYFERNWSFSPMFWFNWTRHQPHHEAQKKPYATSKALTSMMSFRECCLQPIFGGAMEPLWLFRRLSYLLELIAIVYGSIAFECEVPHWKGCERIIVWLLRAYLKYRLFPANWGRQRSSAGYQCNQGQVLFWSLSQQLLSPDVPTQRVQPLFRRGLDRFDRSLSCNVGSLKWSDGRSEN